MTPEASRLIAEQDEARVLKFVLAEVAAASALRAAREMGVAVGLTFAGAFLTTQFNQNMGLLCFLFAPLLVTHLLWFKRIMWLGNAKDAIKKLPLWEKRRVDLLLQRVDDVIKETK
jgi:hypothetical protein